MLFQLLRSTAALSCLCAVRLAALEIYVSPSGSDTGRGTLAQPYATLGRARDEIRTIKATGGLPAGGITIYLRGGTYELTSSFLLESRDSGAADRRIVYASMPGEVARLVGGKNLDPTRFSLVSAASPVWSRLDAAARGRVYQIDLRSQGITDFGTLRPRGFGVQNVSAMELFAGARPMTLARWPNRGEAFVRTASAVGPTRIVYSGTRPERWNAAEEVWLDGFWSSTWAEFHVRVAGWNAAAKTLDFVSPPAQYGVEANRPYYAYNLLEEIDQPGEYYINRSTGMLYLWPAAPLGAEPLQVSMLEGSLVQLSGTQHIVFRDILFEVSRGALVEISGGNNNRIERCLLRNAGQHAAQVSGSSNGLEHCEIYDAGDAGVLLSGGDRASLRPGNNFVSNTRIERTGRVGLSYHPGINFAGGCGNIATHNLLGDMPHAAILFSGNLHRIEYNEIRRVCQLTSDAGAIYAGRDWGYRGNVIQYNFVHHLQTTMEGNGVHGVYLDDGLSGATVFGNVFYRIAGAGIFCGGGRDNLMRNNLMALCEMGHYNGDYAREHFNDVPGSSWNLLERLRVDGIQYQAGAWAAAFPALAAVPNSWSTLLGGLWRNPQNSVFETNAGWSNDRWLFETNVSGTGVFSVYASIANNSATHPPLVDDAASLDRARRPSVLQASLQNFSPIPFASIGPGAPAGASSSPPVAPVLAGQAASGTGIQLVWTSAGNLAHSREAGSVIEQRSGTQAAWTAVQTVGPGADWVNLGGLAPATAYSFRVKAFNAAGAAYSNELTISTPAAAPQLGPAVRTEAESAFSVLSDVGGFGSVGVSDGSLDSGRSIRLFDVGDAVQVRFHIGVTGIYRLGVRARAGDAGLPVATSYWPLGYGFALDGAPIVLKGDVSTLSVLEHSYGPTYWGTMYSEALTLSAGWHVMNVKAGASWAALDYLEAAPLAAPVSKTFGTWQPAYFNPVQMLDAAISGALAMPAGDGVTNLMKYALGLQPWSAVTGEIVQFSMESGGALRLTYARPAGITDLVYTVEVSDDAALWIGIPQIRVSQTDGTETMQATDPGAVARRFIRLGIASAMGNVYTRSFTTPASAPLPAPTSGGRIEIEKAFAVAADAGSFGAVAAHDGTLDSERSVALFDVGDAVRVPFAVKTAGRHRLAVRVRAGDGGATTAFWPGGYRFSLDGVPLTLTGDLASISALDASYGSAYWGTMLVEVPNLGVGDHVLEITAARAWAVVDYLEVASQIEVSPAAVLRVEAEGNYSLASDVGTNGRVGVTNAAADSGESVTLFDVGDSVRISFPVAVTNAFRLAVRVRAGDGGSPTAFWPNGYTFKLDGAPIAMSGSTASVSPVDPSYGPTYWGTMMGDTGTLSAGTHVFEVTAARAWGVLDYIELVPLAAAGTGMRTEIESGFTIKADTGTNGAVLVNNASLDSDRSVSLFDVGDAISVSFTVPAAGSYRVGIRVRAGDGGSATAFWPDGYRFKLDGVTVVAAGDAGTLSAVESAYGPTRWGTMYVESTALGAGTHTLEIAAARAWGVVDYIELTPALAMRATFETSGSAAMMAAPEVADLAGASFEVAAVELANDECDERYQGPGRLAGFSFPTGRQPVVVGMSFSGKTSSLAIAEAASARSDGRLSATQPIPQLFAWDAAPVAPIDGDRAGSGRYRVSSGIYTLQVQPAESGASTWTLRLPDQAGTTRWTALSQLGAFAEQAESMSVTFEVAGAEPLNLLVRAAGPALAGLGFSSPLVDPALTIYRGDIIVAANDNWSDDRSAAALAEATASLGVCPLKVASLDAAVTVSLPPGVYRAVVEARNEALGPVLFEIFEVPSRAGLPPRGDDLPAARQSAAHVVDLGALR